MPNQVFDVVIVGGGVMGCAIAYYLRRAAPASRIVVVEKDPTYAKASTPLSDGNTRLQFNLKENIQMSLYGLEVLSTFAEQMTVNGTAPEVSFRQQGNLFIIDEASREESARGLATQKILGAQVEWLTPAQVQAVYPLFNASHCVGGTLGPLDGTMSPMGILFGYKHKAAELGVEFWAAEVTAIRRDKSRVAGVQLANGETLSAPIVINAAGPWAAPVAQLAGINLPVTPIKRQVTVVETNARPEKILPAIFFPSGLYCFHEGEGVFTCGQSFADDPETLEDFTWERAFFEERLWAELAELMPSFDRLKILRGWAGLYEVNTLDGNAILGEWPELRGFYLANGFSGHGFQHCHAVGRYLAELITGQAPTLDLSIFSPQRVLENRPVFESELKII
jgi:glycine/D-amino acid oxidase-like deaminating enzyme